jgi:ABC-type uncharacterized transport system substrate-binding protein
MSIRYTRLIHASFLLLTLASSQAVADKCLFISSYHQGYAWSDGVERGLRATLKGKCELKQFNMDTKRHKDKAAIQKVALEAKALIESWKPDVVITADDNAAKYVIQPFFKDHTTPFVFCGINWTLDGYGLPYTNTTGMVEVAPIRALFDKAHLIGGRINRAIYIGADTLTEQKNLSRFEKAATKQNITLDHRLVSTTEEWLTAYKTAQAYDAIFIGSHSGVDDWDPEIVNPYVLANTTTPSLTNHDWMMPFTLLGLTKIPDEHGEWAGQAALAILKGAKPFDLPIVSNRKWDIWINHSILKRSGIQLPQTLIRKAKDIH